MRHASSRRCAIVLAALGSVSACATVRPPAVAAVSDGAISAPQQPLVAPAQVVSAGPTPEAQAVHVLSRLTFGVRPGDVDHMLSMGIDRWIDQQLDTDADVDAAALSALYGCPFWSDPIETAVSKASSAPIARLVPTMQAVPAGAIVSVARRDSVIIAIAVNESEWQAHQLLAGRLTRAESSDQQLVEVMTDFWENHFSLYSQRLPGRAAIVEWDRETIRPNALGHFRDLLEAVASDPAMLVYLDNALSTADSTQPTLTEWAKAKASGTAPVIGVRDGLNENYGRELLELHTLGVDGGYTQTDVINVARAFTGWTHSQARPIGTKTAAFFTVNRTLPYFVFDSAKHDAGPKVVLGHVLPAGRGLEDGEDVLDILARHPSTARFIARKLAIRFVSDSPSSALIDSAAATYMRTDGDIREVLRTIVTSAEFRSPANYGAKIKTPVELVLSMRRALGAPVDTAAQEITLLTSLGQTPFGRISPDGWPDNGSAWMNAGAIQTRISIAARVAYGGLPFIPLEAWPSWKTLSVAPFDEQIDGVIRTLLNGQASLETRIAMATSRPVTSDPEAAASRQLALRGLVALALSSPEFQRR